ncbi:MAG: hypothetical protein OXH56_02390 [Gemmatimonadetes bacterium]|nr:hypothetical protein [Gemmatimonadota bacterium]
MTSDQPSLWSDIRGLVFFGWIVAATRLLLDFVAPEQSMFIGVYFLMPLAYLYYGLKGRWDHLAWRRVAGSLLVVVFLVWFIPNLVSYSTALFAGLDHGRFSPQNFVRVFDDEGPVMTILNGAMVAGGTFLAGSVWSVSLGTLFIWLPGAMRRRQARAG